MHVGHYHTSSRSGIFIICILQWVPPVHFIITKPLMLRIYLSVIIFFYLYSACCKVVGEQYVGYYFQVSHNLWINHVHNQCCWSSYGCYLLDSFITLMFDSGDVVFVGVGLRGHSDFWITGLNGIVWDLEMHCHAICWCKYKLLRLVTFMDRSTAYVALQVWKFTITSNFSMTIYLQTGVSLFCCLIFTLFCMHTP